MYLAAAPHAAILTAMAHPIRQTKRIKSITP